MIYLNQEIGVHEIVQLVKTKSQAQTIVTNIINAAQDAWDDLSDEDKAASNGRPATITLP